MEKTSPRMPLWWTLFLVVLGGFAVLGYRYAALNPQVGAPVVLGEVPLFGNLGSYHHVITTTSPQAQQYFDQGLRLIYGFNHDEAKRAFEQALRFDPNCAMAYWGIAYTLGSNYNLPGDPERDRAAYVAVQKALSNADHVSDTERGYIEALAKRYSSNPGPDRRALDLAYTEAMRSLTHHHPEDLDAATLYAESMMDLRPWELWTKDGKPQPGTEEIVNTLESVLKRNPQHPGANHYYIHAVEASTHPERALDSAGRLKKLVPGAGHLVHMPSHIYMRTGRYNEAAQANENAAAVDRAYIKRTNVQGVYPMMYYSHNLHFLYAAAAMEGRSKEAFKAAREVQENVPYEMVHQMQMVEFVTPAYTFALVRFGKWDEILKLPEPPKDLLYPDGVRHYARGLAFVHAGDFNSASQELVVLQTQRKQIDPARLESLNAAVDLLAIAADTLAGEIAAKKNETDAAVRLLKQAIATQDKLHYDEPPPWYYPVRQSLGAVLLSAKRAKEAEAVYREDLQQNPDNGWSLYGLAESLRAQGMKPEAEAVDAQFMKAWARADVTLTASRF